MKKLPLVFGLVGLLSLGCSSQRDKVYEEIFRYRKFDLSKYTQYVTQDLPNHEEGLLRLSLDLDKNKKNDLFITTEIVGYVNINGVLMPKINHYASRVSIDKNEDRVAELIYIDTDKDGHLDITQSNFKIKDFIKSLF